MLRDIRMLPGLIIKITSIISELLIARELMVFLRFCTSLLSSLITAVIPINKMHLDNGEPSSARCLYWSRMKAISFCLENFFYIKNESDLAFHPGPVQPPGGEGSPFFIIRDNNFWVVA